MWDVLLLEEVEQWYLALATDDPGLCNAVTAALDMLQDQGPTLGRPIVDTLKGSTVHNLKELRVDTVRVLFAFDPHRQAIMLVAGDKAGQWKQWYATNIPIAENRYWAWIRQQDDEAEGK